MDPKTGDVLAMATYPSYNLNNPSIINNQEDLEKWDTYSTTEKNEKLMDMWMGDRNISKTYEPGSTFKLIVSAAALEEGIITTDKADDFHCEGAMKMVDDTEIKCAGREVHRRSKLKGST